MTRTAADADAASTSPRLNSRLTMHIGAGLLVQQRRAGARRLLRIDDGRQRFVVDGDQRRRVFGLVAVPGDDAGDRLADIAHFVARQRKNRRGVIIRHARGRDQRLDRVAQIVRREHRDDARRGARRRAIDGADARVRLFAAAERHVRRLRHLPVVGIGAAPGQQPRVLGALDARADDFRPGVNFRQVVHGAKSFMGRLEAASAAVVLGALPFDYDSAMCHSAD